MTVFVALRGHDSGNTSYGIEVDGERFFVKHATEDGPIASLRMAEAFHDAVRHPAIIPLAGTVKTAKGFALIHPWRDGEVLHDTIPPTPASALPRSDPRSTWARFHSLPLDELLDAIDTIFDAHVAVTRAGFVAVDFYDGSVMYDFERKRVYLCDLDLYRRGPYVLDVDRQYGSTRFMAPEEFQRGATIDERTTVFTLGRAAFVFLGRGQRGEEDRALWRAGDALYETARRATRPRPSDRYQTVEEWVAAWRAARRNSVA